jgi:hypothetical protein
MTATNKISEESARLQIENWLEYYGLNFSDIEIEDGEAAAKTLMNTLVRAIQKGQLEVAAEDELKVVHRLTRKIGEIDVITYEDKVSRARIAMDKVPAKHTQQRQYSFMSALCGLPASELSKLKAVDAAIFTRISLVFSMV